MPRRHKGLCLVMYKNGDEDLLARAEYERLGVLLNLPKAKRPRFVQAETRSGADITVRTKRIFRLADITPALEAAYEARMKAMPDPFRTEVPGEWRDADGLGE